jgi:glutathione S-transferase
MRSLEGLEEGFKRTEETLEDGRKWVLGGDGLSLADINGFS